MAWAIDQAERDKLEQGYKDYKVTSAPKNPGGARGLLLNFLPTIAGGAGAVIGTVAGPAGTIAGGSVGAGLGEYLRQKLTGEATDGVDKGNIVQEGALGALPGIFKGIKAIRAAKGIEGAVEATEAAATASKAAKTAQTTEEALQLASKENKLTRFGKTLQDDARGTAVGTKVAKGTDKSSFLQPKTAKIINADIDTLPGKTPAEKLASLEARQAEVGKSLGETISAGNRATTIGDLDTITAKAGAQSKKIQGWDNEIASEANRTIAGAKSLDELYAVRKDLDDSLQSFYKAAVNDSSATAKAKTLKAYRDGVDEVLGEVPGFKEANKAYSQGLKTQDVLSRAANKKNDIKIFGVNTGVGGETIAKAKETVGGIARNVGGAGAPPPSGGGDGFRPFMGTAGKIAKASVPQAGYRAGASMLFGTPFVGSPQEDQAAPDYEAMLAGDQAAPGQQPAEEPASTSPFAPENAEANIQKILAEGGTMKDVSEYVSLVKAFESFKPKAAKPLNATAASNVTDLQSGLANIKELSGQYETSGANNPVTGWLRSKNPLDTDAKSLQANTARVKQIIGKALEGGVLRKEDEVKYQKILPTINDTDAVAQSKIKAITADLERKLALYMHNLGGGDGGGDLSSLLPQTTD